jgi:hypothetical protein
LLPVLPFYALDAKNHTEKGGVEAWHRLLREAKPLAATASRSKLKRRREAAYRTPSPMKKTWVKDLANTRTVNRPMVEKMMMKRKMKRRRRKTKGPLGGTSASVSMPTATRVLVVLRLKRRRMRTSDLLRTFPGRKLCLGT